MDNRRWARFQAKRQAIERARQRLAAVRLNPTAQTNRSLAALGSAPLKRPHSAAELLRRPELGLAELASLHPGLEPLADLPAEAAEQVAIEAHYAGYQERERRQVARFRASEKVTIPPGLDYASLPGLSHEVVEKLSRVRPASLGQAGRISGITPAALSILSIHLHRLAGRSPRV